MEYPYQLVGRPNDFRPDQWQTIKKDLLFKKEIVLELTIDLPNLTTSGSDLPAVEKVEQELRDMLAKHAPGPVKVERLGHTGGVGGKLGFRVTSISI